MSDIIAQIIKRRKEEQEIRCPHCGTIQPDDDNQYPVTYWGEDDVVECECVECEKKFLVDEIVERSYMVGRYYDKWGQVTDDEPEEVTNG